MRGRHWCNSLGWGLSGLVALWVGPGCGRGPFKVGTRDADIPDRRAGSEVPQPGEVMGEIPDTGLPDLAADLPVVPPDLAPEPQDLAAEGAPSEVGAVDAGMGVDACIPGGCKDPVCGRGYCGKIGDGCGGMLDCGSACRTGEYCGTESMCTSDVACLPLICNFESLASYCGDIGNGCDGVLHCGTTCPQAGWTCVDHICVGPPDCVPLVCDNPWGRYCGVLGDGCGRVLDCGICPTPGWLCDLSLTSRCMGSVDCIPISSCDGPSGERYCGDIGDGCGGSLHCGACPDSDFSCLDNACARIIGCAQVDCVLADGGRYCGVIGDGCGGLKDCAACPDGSACGTVRANECGAGTTAPPPRAPMLPLPAPPLANSPPWALPPPPPVCTPPPPPPGS